MQQDEERAQSYRHLAGVMFVAIDREGVVTLANRKSCEVPGYKEKEAFGKNWFENFVRESHQKSRRKSGFIDACSQRGAEK